MRIDGPQITGSFNLNGDTVADLDVFATTSSLNTYTSSIGTTMGHVNTATHSLNTFTSSATTKLNSIEGVTGSYATTGSNLFNGTQTLSGSIIPAVNNTYDLGSPTNQFRHVYISSGSLYVNGVKVLGSTSQELQITTDVGQSFKILESGADTITLQSGDGNVTLTSSGQGDIVLDPTTGVIGLKGTVTIYTGNKIVSSDGNSIQFGNGIAVTGSIVSTVTPLVSGSSQITYSGLSGVPSGIISGSGQLTTLGIATTGSNTFNGNLTVTGFIDTQELRTTYISSSILYRSGSTKFGDELTDTHSFTGSILISGSLSVPGSNLVSGSSQVLNGSGVWSGSAQLPSGIVSGSAQTIANLPSGVVSGSAQTIANLPSGTVSGSSQVLFTGTTGYSTYINQAVLTSSSPTFAGLTNNGTYTQTTTSTQPVYITGDSGDTSGVFRIQIDSVSDSFGTGARTFLGDGGIDIFLGTGNSSYTPVNTYIALNHSGEISMGAGSATKHFILSTSGAATLSSSLTVNGIYYVQNTSYFVGGTQGFRFNNSADTFNNFIVKDNGDTYTRGNASVGITTADNTYQGITIYGTNPSLRLKGSSGSSWTWVEFATSGGTNNFSMGVNQTTPTFVIKAGAGLDSPNFTLSSAGAATFSNGVEAASFYTNDTRYIANQIQSGYNANSEDSDIWINYTGYQGGTTRFRDFRVGNGKQGQIALFDGSTGYVGIGGITPIGLLDVYKSTSGGLGGHIMLRNNGAAVGNEMAVMFVDGDASTMRAAISSTTEGAPYFGDIKFKTGLGTYASLTTRMTVSGEGKVGIGFTPSYKLQVAGEITTHAGTNTSYYAYMNYLGTTYNFGSGETTDNVDFKIVGGSTFATGGNFRWFTQPGGTTPTERFRITPTNAAFSNKLTVGGTTIYAASRIAAEGAIKASNTVYSWFQAGTNSWDGYQYLHLKTNMSSGASGNVDHTMSLFTGRLYSYSSAYIREGSFGFHNWSGVLYNPVLTGNFFAGGYGSSDGYVVLIVALGGGSYMGVNIDWHQSYPYGFRDRIVTSYNHSNSSASLY